MEADSIANDLYEQTDGLSMAVVQPINISH